MLRADAGPEIGAGHVMRCLAIAQSWQDCGGEAVMVSAECPDSLSRRIVSEGLAHELLSCPVGGPVDTALTRDAADKHQSEWLVVDGYRFDSRYHAGVRAPGRRLLVIDDYGQCAEWRADVVLNANLFAEGLDCYPDAGDCRFLLGPRYALLRREFRSQVDVVKPPASGDTAIRLLLTFGGGDWSRVTEKFLRLLERATAPLLDVRVLLGPANCRREQIEAAASTLPFNAVVMQDVHDMPSQYAWADVVISAAGGTCFEWLSYNLPAAVVCTAENQLLNASALEELSLATNLGWHEDVIEVAALEDFLWGSKDPLRRPARFFDSLGAERVVATMVAEAEQ